VSVASESLNNVNWSANITPMPSRKFRIGRATTGLGLFATKKIARRAAIVTYAGKMITTAEANRRERRFNARYMFEVNRHWTIDGSSRRNLGRYVNHSCAPNAEAVMRKRKIVFVAARTIAPGEEITVDYGEEYFAHFFKTAGCRCTACERKNKRRKSIRRKPAKR
jgi:SET domain-containing protein